MPGARMVQRPLVWAADLPSKEVMAQKMRQFARKTWEERSSLRLMELEMTELDECFLSFARVYKRNLGVVVRMSEDQSPIIGVGAMEHYVFYLYNGSRGTFKHFLSNFLYSYSYKGLFNELHDQIMIVKGKLLDAISASCKDEEEAIGATQQVVNSHRLRWDAAVPTGEDLRHLLMALLEEHVSAVEYQCDAPELLQFIDGILQARQLEIVGEIEVENGKMPLLDKAVLVSYFVYLSKGYRQHFVPYIKNHGFREQPNYELLLEELRAELKSEKEMRHHKSKNGQVGGKGHDQSMVSAATQTVTTVEEESDDRAAILLNVCEKTYRDLQIRFQHLAEMHEALEQETLDQVSHFKSTLATKEAQIGHLRGKLLEMVHGKTENDTLAVVERLLDDKAHLQARNKTLQETIDKLRPLSTVSAQLEKLQAEVSAAKLTLTQLDREECMSPDLFPDFQQQQPESRQAGPRRPVPIPKPAVLQREESSSSYGLPPYLHQTSWPSPSGKPQIEGEQIYYLPTLGDSPSSGSKERPVSPLVAVGKRFRFG